MKQIAKNVLKGLLIIVLFTGGSIVLSTKGVKTISEASACVKAQDVIDYLEALGYHVVSLREIEGTENWSCHTILNGIHYNTTVIVEGDQIVTSTDILM